MEATYETPWEYQTRPPSNRSWTQPKIVTARRDGAAAVLNANGFVQSVVKGKKVRDRSTPLSPIPSLRTSQTPQPSIRRSKLRPESAPQQTPSVWEPRGPDADPRDSNDYEVPWDRNRSSITAQLQNTLSVSVSQRSSLTPAQTYEHIWDATSGRPNGRTSVSPRDTSSTSPASSSSTWSSGKESKSSLSSASSESVPPGLVRPWPPSDFAGSPQPPAISPAFSYGSSNTLVKSPATPLLETAFVNQPKSSRLSREEEERERVIQRLCQDLGDVSRPEPSPRPSRQPFPPLSALQIPPKTPPKPPHRDAPGGVYDNVADSIANRVPLSVPTPIPRLPSPRVSSPRLPEQPQIPQTSQEPTAPDYDVPWEFNQKKINRLLQKRASKKDAFGKAGDRGALSLNLGGLTSQGQTKPSTPPELTGPLELADWFHGRVTRVEAERRLASAPEGSYLVRLCEPHRRSTSSHDGPHSIRSKPREYALSLKSAAGFMHMKIQERAPSPSTGLSSSHWVLGYFSSPFPTIPAMLSYYNSHQLPIKGADHMSLRFPLKDTLL